MYIGIYISDSFISAGTVNQDNEVLLIKDESNKGAKKYLTPLKIYIEDDFAYLGNQVDYLIANDYKLNYKERFLDALGKFEVIAYEDKTNTSWNGVGILSVFLKKLKSDISVFDDHPIQGAVITLSRLLTPTMVKALKRAFEMVDIPFCGVVDMGKAALLGYGIKNTSLPMKHALLYTLHPSALTINILSIDEDNYKDTVIFETNKQLGEHILYNDISDFILKRYEEITKINVNQSHKNTRVLHKLTEEILYKYSNESHLYITLICAFDDAILELIVTRSQIETIITSYIEKTMNFLKGCLKTSEIEMNQVSEIMLTGTSKILKRIEKGVQLIFDDQEIVIYNSDPDKVVTKGVTRYANTTVDREISASLLSDTQKAVESKEDSSTKTTLKTKELNRPIHKMHINMGCDV